MGSLITIGIILGIIFGIVIGLSITMMLINNSNNIGQEKDSHIERDSNGHVAMYEFESSKSPHILFFPDEIN